jgi:hypothetical protein
MRVPSSTYSPATPERLRMACADHLTAPFAKHDLRPKISV